MFTTETKILLKYVDSMNYDISIKCYMKNGGYEALSYAIHKDSDEIKKEIVDSGIRGRGGAGFPTGVKWNLIDYSSKKPIYLICNADESEPGTFKDRQIIHKDPHQLIEGIIISAYAIRSNMAFIYIRGEMFQGYYILEKAIDEAYLNNILGRNILNSKYHCDLIVYRGAGAYICGEETGLIESLEGKRAYPRIKPPYFPATLGLYQCPTIVNNVETICNIKHIVNMGGKNFKKIGVYGNTGTRIWCVSGQVKRPGYYEYPCGNITLGKLIYEVCGGLYPGRSLQAVIPGGTSSKVLRFDERYQGKLKNGKTFDWGICDIPMDFDSLMACGSMAGSGAVIVIDNSVNIVEVLGNINYFYAHESCGQCTPCREGSLWMSKITQRMNQSESRYEDTDLLYSLSQQIVGKTICAHGEACSWPTESFVSKFTDNFINKSRQKLNTFRLV